MCCRGLLIAKDIARGLAYLHQNAVIHLDIKSACILIAQRLQSMRASIPAASVQHNCLGLRIATVRCYSLQSHGMPSSCSWHQARMLVVADAQATCKVLKGRHWLCRSPNILLNAEGRAKVADAGHPCLLRLLGADVHLSTTCKLRSTGMGQRP